jgi:hypothetical protein
VSDPLRFDAHDWMRQLRLPYWTVSILREMRVDDERHVLNVEGPAVGNRSEPTVVRVIFSREPTGVWSYEALWTLSVGKRVRPHVYTMGHFKLHPGSIVELRPSYESMSREGTLKAARLLMLICRRAARLSLMAEKGGDRAHGMALRPMPRKPHDPIRVPYLETLAASGARSPSACKAAAQSFGT